MENSRGPATRGMGLQGYVWKIVLLWTVFAATVLLWDVLRLKHGIRDVAPLSAIGKHQILMLALGQGVLWLLGLIGINVGARRLRRRIRERDRAEEALKRSQIFLQTVIDTSPEPMMVIDREFHVVLANSAARRLSGSANVSSASSRCHQVLHQRDTFCSSLPEQCPMERITETKEPLTVTHTHYDAHGNRIFAEISAAPILNDLGEVTYVIETCRDVTKGKRVEESMRFTNRLLQTANEYSEVVPLLKAFVSEIKEFTGCGAVGIRMLGEDGHIPYRAYEGFDQAFYDVENLLSVRADHCMCINVIDGTTDPKMPFYTKGGSFYMNATTAFLSTVSEEDKGRTRNVCNRFGYESVALVPIRSGDRILGLIHVADREENKVPWALVEVLESAAMQLGTAIRRVVTEQALKEARDLLELRVEERTAELETINRQLKEEIREREQVEEVLREQSRILEAFFKHTITPLVFLDREFNFIRVNEAYAKAGQRDISEFPGHNHFEFYPSDAQPIFEEVVKTKTPFQVFARPFVYADHPEWGETYWDWTLVPILDSDKEVEFLVFSLKDVTERKRAEEKVLELHKQLADLSDQERRRIGQELHDNLGQQLTGMGMLLKSLHQKLEAKGLPEAENAFQILSCVREAQSQARSLARGLIPVQMDGKGLMSALEDLVYSFGALSGVRCQFRCKEPIFIEDNNVATQLFRIAQEAISNAVQHGRPKNVFVHLESRDDLVSLQVLDDGIGIAGGENRSEGMGLRTMRYRADIIGATLRVDPLECGGTIVTCTLSERSFKGGEARQT